MAGVLSNSGKCGALVLLVLDECRQRTCRTPCPTLPHSGIACAVVSVYFAVGLHVGQQGECAGCCELGSVGRSAAYRFGLGLGGCFVAAWCTPRGEGGPVAGIHLIGAIQRGVALIASLATSFGRSWSQPSCVQLNVGQRGGMVPVVWIQAACAGLAGVRCGQAPACGVGRPVAGTNLGGRA